MHFATVCASGPFFTVYQIKSTGTWWPSLTKYWKIITVIPSRTVSLSKFSFYKTKTVKNICIQEKKKHNLASSRLSVSEDDRKCERAKSGISGERDPGEKRRGRDLFPYQTPLVARSLFQSSTDREPGTG